MTRFAIGIAKKFSTALDISIAVLDGEGHLITPEKVSKAVHNFLHEEAQI